MKYTLIAMALSLGASSGVIITDNYAFGFVNSEGFDMITNTGSVSANGLTVSLTTPSFALPGNSVSYNNFQFDGDGSFGTVAEASLNTTSGSTIRTESGFNSLTFTLSLATSGTTILQSIDFLGFDFDQQNPGASG